jgi:hypothetical protein
MALKDGQPIHVTFACCGHKAMHSFGALKTSPPDDGFVCAKCRTVVQYDRYEFVALMNQQPQDAPYEFVLRPREDNT